MIASKILPLLAASTMALSASVVSAQTSDASQTSGKQEDRIGAILGTLFGDRLGASTSIEAQWAAGRKPLTTQRSQFIARIDTDVRSGALSAANGAKMKSEYDQLVALETRYGADNRFTIQERTELGDRYGALTQALTDGGFADNDSASSLSVVDGRTEFNRRVDAGVTARRLSRTEGSRLKSDYAALIQTEATYARDGISAREREDLDSRLDALDSRVGDTGYTSGPAALDNRTRLSNIERAINTSGLNATAKAQIRVELGDLTRLESAYSRAAPTDDDRAYLERRITDLETRVPVRR